MVEVPKYIFLTKGKGINKDRLTSFEMALRDADIASYNIVRVSSIYPPKCKLISKKRGLEKLADGAITYAVIAENATHEPHRLLAASIGLAIPRDVSRHGYLSEYHTFGKNEKETGDYAEDLAASMLSTIVGVESDPNANWDERRELWKISGKIVKTRNITQSIMTRPANIDSREWTTVLAAAVFTP